VLFLDEVTSGLDLGTEAEMMQLFRELADGGVTIILITHFLDSLARCDNVVCLMRGKLVFHGPPADMKAHFGIDEMRDVYALEKAASPEQWQHQFALSPRGVDVAQQVATLRGSQPPPQPGTTKLGPLRRRAEGFDLREFFLQWSILTRRYARLMLMDRKMLFFLLALAPVIGVMLCIYAGSIDVPADLADGADWKPLAERPTQQAEVQEDLKDYANYFRQQRMLLFGMLLGAMFLAMFSSVQEIVKEASVYLHERFVKLQLAPYLLSKLLPLCVLGALQVLLLAGTVHVFADIDAGSLLSQFPLLMAVSLVGTLVGLTISGGVPGGKDAGNLAVLLMIAVVIPQVLFAGGVGPLSGAAETLGQVFVTCYWGLEGLSSMIAIAPPPDQGMGNLRGDGVIVPMIVTTLHAAILTVLLTIFMLKKDKA
ncbi:MAG: ABC transporter permease, partial [Planctomycetota bacterium]